MNRKIMVEVTPQELEKIQAGKLNSDDLEEDDLVNKLILMASEQRNGKTGSYFDTEELQYISVTEHIFEINTKKYGVVRLIIDEKEKLRR